MTIELPSLPYAHDALEPTISEETISYHYGKHHQAYVNKLNASISGTELENASLEDIIKMQDAKTFNNAAQVWNHTFYWNCMSPNGGGEAQGELADAINAAFGSLDQFKEQFNQKAMGNFGSGWTWLVKNGSGELEIVNTDDAETPITDSSLTPILTADVWEHAYYVDYRNDRGQYLESFWNVVNWEFAQSNFAA